MCLTLDIMFILLLVGMSLDPRNAMLPANRAMALLKKYQYGAAETDCTLALSIDNTYVKVGSEFD